MKEGKLCLKCGTVQPFVDFSWQSAKHEKRRNVCRECVNANNSKLHRLHPDRDRAYYHAVRTKDRRKLRARGIVTSSVFRGTMVKPKRCADCRTVLPAEKLQGHHEDYDRARDVAWVCDMCHTIRHERLILQPEEGQLALEMA